MCPPHRIEIAMAQLTFARQLPLVELKKVFQGKKRKEAAADIFKPQDTTLDPFVQSLLHIKYKLLSSHSFLHHTITSENLSRIDPCRLIFYLQIPNFAT